MGLNCITCLKIYIPSKSRRLFSKSSVPLWHLALAQGFFDPFHFGCQFETMVHMKVEITESIKYRANFYKTLGLVFGSPCGITGMDLIRNLHCLDIWYLVKFIIGILLLPYSYHLANKGYNLLIEGEQPDDDATK